MPSALPCLPWLCFKCARCLLKFWRVRERNACNVVRRSEENTLVWSNPLIHSQL